ncbi:SMP-30/gluconolactonase/LRE family protein [Microbacterium sp. SS28]|uniref:SMP-30/gluconolactonase/LRE family protein n=1 Tax=Microbacterium sp. SS28 TaxID=2919948 RepID=UPI001FA97358|nr:SMP-30/gluconolactonase/LRE family protein [Microbacterium sp. SS28]
MTVITAAAATRAEYELAEGIVWDDRANLVRWVDIWKGRVLSGRLNKRLIVDVDSIEIGQTAGAVAVAEDGGLLVAAARGLAVIAPDGTISYGPDLLGDRGDVRLNDGSVDPQGRFIVGTLAVGDETGAEVLLRVSPGGAVETLRTGIRLSNGIAFSPDGRTIYHVDTLANMVSSHSYGPGAFDLDEPWAPVLTDLPHYPDGLAVSRDGSLWVAQWGGSSIRHHATSGELLDVINVFATQASCPAFIGPDLNTLAITTAQEGLEDWSDASGAIFLASVGATGLPVPRWRGSTTSPSWHTEKETHA